MGVGTLQREGAWRARGKVRDSYACFPVEPLLSFEPESVCLDCERNTNTGHESPCRLTCEIYYMKLIHKHQPSVDLGVH